MNYGSRRAKRYAEADSQDLAENEGSENAGGVILIWSSQGAIGWASYGQGCGQSEDVRVGGSQDDLV